MGVIEVGLAHSQEFEDELYLHNTNWTYVGESKPWEKININIMNSIMSKLLKEQKSREQAVLKQLGCSLEELNKFIISISNGDFSQQVEEIENSIVDIVRAAADKSFVNANQLYRNRANETVLYQSINDTIQNFTVEKENEFNKLINVLNKEGLSENFAILFDNYRMTRKGKARKMDNFINQVAKIMGDYYYNLTLEASDNIINSLFSNNKTIKKTKVNIPITQSVEFNKVQLKQQESNKTMRMKLGGPLDSVYNSLKSVKFSDSEYQQILNLVDKFNSNNFKYHLIHQAVIYAKQSNSIGNTSNITKTLLNFIKKCIPIYLGLEVKRKTDNSDFFIIDNKVVPCSTILEHIFYSQNYGSNIDLTYNTQINLRDMLKEKKNVKVASIQEFYNKTERDIGSKYGQEVYSNIQMTTFNLSTTLKNLM